MNWQCLEHETTVADRGQMHGALLTVGFVPTVRISKTRRVGAWDAVTVGVDVVDGLGTFLELEMMASEDDSGTAIQQQLRPWVSSLGLTVERVTETYDSLLRTENEH